MSARFIVNFVVLLIGAGLVVLEYAFAASTADWVALGVGATAIIVALYGFAQRDQGVYQRVADAVICVLGAWTIVAARVMSYQGRWLEVGAGLGLVTLGAVGLLVREIRLGPGLKVGAARIGPDQLAALSALQRDAGVQP